MLRNLREAIQYVTQYEDDFVQRAADQSLRERDKELAQKKDSLAQSQKRIAELDVIIKRLYEDNISGKLSDERFIKLSRDYELEQTNLTNLVEHLRQEVKEQEKQKVNVRQFIAAVRKYTDMQQLDAPFSGSLWIKFMSPRFTRRTRTSHALRSEKLRSSTTSLVHLILRKQGINPKQPKRKENRRSLNYARFSHINVFLRNHAFVWCLFCCCQTSEGLAHPGERRAWTARGSP